MSVFISSSAVADVFRVFVLVGLLELPPLSTAILAHRIALPCLTTDPISSAFGRHRTLLSFCQESMNREVFPTSVSLPDWNHPAETNLVSAKELEEMRRPRGPTADPVTGGAGVWVFGKEPPFLGSVTTFQR